MIQQGVSTGDSSGSDGQGDAIGRIMDYVEARLEAIRSREEEEDEDEEKERERAGGATTGSNTSKPASAGAVPPPVVAPKHPPTSVQTPSAAPARSKDVVSPLLLSVYASVHANHRSPQSTIAPPTPHTPSTFSANASSTLSPINVTRAAKSRLYALATAKDPSLVSTPPSPFSFDPPATAMLSSPPALDITPDVSVGSKRRHNIMTLDSPSPTESGPSTRRRTRSARGVALAASQEQNSIGDAMDVEEEGRERKRVARR